MAARGTRAASRAMRRIGVLTRLSRTIRKQARIAAFRKGCSQSGLDRWPQRADRLSLGRRRRRPIAKYAAELVALAPDVIVATGTSTVAPLLQSATCTIPIVFVQVADPVGSRFVESLARPGGNITGFSFRIQMVGKWLELLKEIAPNVKRVAVSSNPATVLRSAIRAASRPSAPSLGVEFVPVDMRDAGEIERTIAAFARDPDGGLIVDCRAHWSIAIAN